MPTEAIECLLQQLVMPEGGLLIEAAAALGPGKLAHIQGEAVYDRDLGVIRQLPQQIAPQPLLDPQSVRCTEAKAGNRLTQCHRK
ncbi:MAG: hypothetical protein QXQ53_06500 [Candidatus Methanosuratincola sp.]